MPRQFFSRYTHDLTSEELGKLFTRETPEASCRLRGTIERLMSGGVARAICC